MEKMHGRCQFVKDWPEWDKNIHDEDSQIKRQGYAMTYPFTFDINKESQTARFSSTTDLPYYDTSLSSCTCYDFQDRRLPCKHIYRLAVELGIIDIIKRHAKPNSHGSTFNKEALEEIRNSEDIDSTPDQIKRQKSAKSCKLLSIDYDNASGIFAGSGKSPYETTLNTCTCRDFFVRRLPCKHIYRLRMELKTRT